MIWFIHWSACEAQGIQPRNSDVVRPLGILNLGKAIAISLLSPFLDW